MNRPAKSPDLIVDYRDAPTPPHDTPADSDADKDICAGEYIPASIFDSLFKSQMLSATGRLSVENNRLNAENDRLNSENKRLSAENARVSSENKRLSDEATRINAKYDRLYKQIRAYSQCVGAFESLA